MEEIINYFKKNLLVIVFIGLLVLLFVYVFSSCFRYFLYILNIDPNFIVVFITALTLIFSAIENKKERKYNFNLNLKNSVENKVELVVGKLFVMMNDSQIFLNTIKDIKKSIDENKKFVDVNNVLSLEHIKKDRGLVGAYVAIYFHQYIQEDWNLMVENINKIATNCSMVVTNYSENFSLISTKDFQNETLSSIGKIIEESEILNKKIFDLTEKMKNILLDIIKKNNDKIKERYIN